MRVTGSSGWSARACCVSCQVKNTKGAPCLGDPTYGSGPPAPAVRDAIAQTRGFRGVTGTITINAERNADKPASS